MLYVYWRFFSIFSWFYICSGPLSFFGILPCNFDSGDKHDAGEYNYLDAILGSDCDSYFVDYNYSNRDLSLCY